MDLDGVGGYSGGGGVEICVSVVEDGGEVGSFVASGVEVLWRFLSGVYAWKVVCGKRGMWGAVGFLCSATVSLAAGAGDRKDDLRRED